MKRTLAALATVAALGCTVNAHAGGIPVIDVAAIAQMVEQMVYLKGQLDQMKSLYNSTIGSRGLGGLINNPQARSYLPSDVNGVLTTVQTGKSGDLVGLARQILGQNSVLNTKQLGALSGNNQTKINDQRGQAAAQSAAAQLAFKAASERFDTLQVLVDSIDAQTDPKAIQDLQARIQAEQVMLQNENAKLQALASATAAQKQLNEQRSREEAVRFINTDPPRF
ncbi:P-type DNA transfer protein VirB5 [Cupriavidus basilensis]|jgi:type IV secretion system protein VirB5|uniref:P-type DNA transfer protein VirB5 n=1 Tax=Cupriavidus basilensis TaxID=68895 RepID=UPI0023E7847A|nr:P-type DNA transfer protein VirB5 [Cupriavidus basilensis]MDF3883104.1 P-type DNA transfer protein VirB5 [Cupriavidus basilensis]